MIVDQRPALILLDWMMPGGVSGVDVAVSNAMKISLKFQSLYSRHVVKEDHKVQGLDAGADDYID